MLQDRGVLVQEGARYAVRGDDLRARRARDAPGARRLAARRPLGRRAIAAAGRLGARPVVHRRGGGGGQLAGPSRRSRRCSTASSPSRSWRATTTRARPSGASTSSSRRCCGRWPTARSRAGRARRGTWPRRVTCSRPGRARRGTSPRCWRRTTWRRSGPTRTPRTSRARCARRPARRSPRRGEPPHRWPSVPRPTATSSQAAELADDDLERAALFEQAGRALWHSGDPDAGRGAAAPGDRALQRSGRASGGRAAIALAVILVPAGQARRGPGVARAVSRERRPGLDPILRAEAIGELGRVLVLAGKLEEGRPAARGRAATLEHEEESPALATA